MLNEQAKLRMAKANLLLWEIASCGRRFFREGNQVSCFELDGLNRICFRDKYTGELLLAQSFRAKKWQVKFTEGGTLLALIEALTYYIKHGHKLVWARHLGPLPEWRGGDVWGYGEDNMKRIRAKALALDILEPGIAAAMEIVQSASRWKTIAADFAEVGGLWKGQAGELADLVTKLKDLLGDKGDYSIHRGDNTPMNIVEAVMIGNLLDGMDKVLARINAGRGVPKPEAEEPNGHD